MKKDPGLHEGHRERMFARLVAEGELQDHELLETLLFFALPRRDTNDLAHRLIERFGSLPAVLEETADALTEVEGIGPAAAREILLVGKIARRYLAEKTAPRNVSPVFDSVEKIADFLRPRYIGLGVERVYLLLFDNGMRLLDCYHVGDGSVTSAVFSVRQIAERAYRKHAAAVVLAHNHPHGLPVPSSEDIAVTRQLESALRLLEIPLLEHMVFADEQCTQILAQYIAVEQPRAASPLLEVMKRKMKEEGKK